MMCAVCRHEHIWTPEYCVSNVQYMPMLMWHLSNFKIMTEFERSVFIPVLYAGFHNVFNLHDPEDDLLVGRNMPQNWMYRPLVYVHVVLWLLLILPVHTCRFCESVSRTECLTYDILVTWLKLNKILLNPNLYIFLCYRFCCLEQKRVFSLIVWRRPMQNLLEYRAWHMYTRCQCCLCSTVWLYWQVHEHFWNTVWTSQNL